MERKNKKANKIFKLWQYRLELLCRIEHEKERSVPWETEPNTKY